MVVAIIPAYNEEQTIGSIIETLLECAFVDRIIVINDGSEDQTAQVAQSYPIEVINLPENVGKGGAMSIGVQQSTEDVLLFVDADLIGLNPEHIYNLLKPVIQGNAEMSVGVFEDGRLATDLAQKIAPFLSGQRAVKRSLFEQIPGLEHTRYGVEVALSRFAESNDSNVEIVNLPDVSQVMKEEKQGLVKGLCARMKMYWEIVKSVRD